MKNRPSIDYHSEFSRRLVQCCYRAIADSCSRRDNTAILVPFPKKKFPPSAKLCGTRYYIEQKNMTRYLTTINKALSFSVLDITSAIILDGCCLAV